MKKRLLLVVLCAALVLGGCATEQTIVRKVNEPGALDEVEELKRVALPWENAWMIALAPDNQTALMIEDGGLSIYRSGKKTAMDVPFDVAAMDAERLRWSPNCRYALLMGEQESYAMDLDALAVTAFPPVKTACFNADQSTLYYVVATPEGGSTLMRQKPFEGKEGEMLLTLDDTLHGDMFRTTKNQYLVLGNNRLLCLEQVNAGQPWSVRVVADFAPSGITAEALSYSAQTALCIVSGATAEGYMVFSVVSPDGKDFAIDKVSCFSPLHEEPVRNLAASELSALADAVTYPVVLRRVQLSPGGLYLMLWGKDADSGDEVMYLLNLDKGNLTQVQFADEIALLKLTHVQWCAGKTLLLTDEKGNTCLASLTGWDD